MDPKDIKGLADWVKAHTEGGGNTLILTGITPSTIYPIANAKPDGSLLEEFIDAGNTVFNTGEYTFYTSEGPDETNGQAALPHIIDVPEAFVWMNKGPDGLGSQSSGNDPDTGRQRLHTESEKV